MLKLAVRKGYEAVDIILSLWYSVAMTENQAYYLQMMIFGEAGMKIQNETSESMIKSFKEQINDSSQLLVKFNDETYKQMMSLSL